MMTEMDDPMVLESRLPYPKDLDRSVLAARAQEMQVVVPENGVFESCVVDSPASGAMEVTEQVFGAETSPSAPTHRPVSDDMNKHGDGAQNEAAAEENPALPVEPSEGGRVTEIPFESSTFLSPNSGILNNNAGEGTQEKRRNRAKNWAKKDTDDLLRAVSNMNKVFTRVEQGSDSDSYWDVIAKEVRGRTGHECRGRMDTLKRSFSTTKNYCDGHGKEFKQLTEKDFGEIKVSPRLTEAWYNQIRDYCPHRSKKKLRTNGAGSSSESNGFESDISTLGKANGWSCPCLSHELDAIMLTNPSPDSGGSITESTSSRTSSGLCTSWQGRSPSCDWNLNHTGPSSEIDFDKADTGIKSNSELHDIRLCHAHQCLASEELPGLGVVEILWSLT